MSENSYKLYYNNRPLKILFLLSDKDKDSKIKNAIIYNITLWGGRFNQIIVLKKKNRDIILDEIYKQQITAFDPDLIITSFIITKKFKNEVYNIVSPLFIERSDFKSPYFLTSQRIEPIRLHPYLKNLSIFNEFQYSPLLINFNIEDLKSNTLSTFIKVNFGYYDENMYYMREVKETNRLKSYNINNYKDLDIFIDDFVSNFSTKIFPIQISSQPNYKSNNTYNHYSDSFFVFLGDDIEEVSLSWNRSCYINSWKQKYINQLFVSTDTFTKSKNILKLIERLSNLNGSNPPKVVFYSKTYSKSKLEEIIINKISNTGNGIYFEILEEVPNYNFSFYGSYLVDKYKYITLSKNEDNLLLSKPDVYPFNFGDGYYMSDIYIEYCPYKFKYTNKIYWWQFPLKNYIAKEITKGKESRVLLNRNLSTLMNMSENSNIGLDRDNYNNEFANLNIKLPENDYYFFRIIFLLNEDFYLNHKWNFKNLSISISGKKLLSTIQLFGNLFESKYYLENKAWNNVFYSMSNWKENVIFKKLSERIKKTLPLQELESINNSNYEEIIEKITSTTKKEVTGLHLSKKEELRFKDIYELISKYYLKYIDESEINKKIKSELYEFCSKSVFTMGLKPYCYRCNNQNWFSINNLNKKVFCIHCNNEFILEPEQEWYYKLNDLVKQLYEGNGLYPVILALGQLQEDARDSFIYFGSLDLYKDDKNKLTDLDIVCIQDGKLIIGEVKENSDLFKKRHFDEFLEFSKIIIPDLVIFTSLNKPTEFVKSEIKSLNNNLKKHGLKTIAKWYEIREVLEF